VNTISRFGLICAALIGFSAGAAFGADPVAAPSAPAVTAAPDSAAARADSAPASPATTMTPARPVTSLMFTPDEVQAINKAIADHLHPPAEMVEAKAQAVAAEAAVAEARKPRVPNIYVSAVVDFGGGDWTVWANGLKVTPDRQPPLFRVVAVDGNTVDIVPRSAPGTHVHLHPYQTWRSRQGDVVEGIIP